MAKITVGVKKGPTTNTTTATTAKKIGVTKDKAKLNVGRVKTGTKPQKGFSF